MIGQIVYIRYMIGQIVYILYMIGQIVYIRYTIGQIVYIRYMIGQIVNIRCMVSQIVYIRCMIGQKKHLFTYIIWLVRNCICLHSVNDLWHLTGLVTVQIKKKSYKAFFFYLGS